MAYFVTLLRYIHQNPTKAGIVSKVGDYDWSSWKEYTGEVPVALGLCATNAILKRMSLDELKEPRSGGRFFDPFLIKGLKYPVRNKSH